MNAEHDSNTFRREVIDRLVRLEGKVDKVRVETVPSIHTEIALLKQKVAFIGTVSGLAASAAVHIVAKLFK